MTEQEYIETLENTIIFMCKTYEDCMKEFMYKPETCERFPTIQGTGNIIAIKRISDLIYNSTPQHGFRDILNKLEAKVLPQAIETNE